MLHFCAKMKDVVRFLNSVIFVCGYQRSLSSLRPVRGMFVYNCGVYVCFYYIIELRGQRTKKL